MKQKKMQVFIMMAVMTLSVTACGGEKESSEQAPKPMEEQAQEPEEREEQPEEDSEVEETEKEQEVIFKTDAEIEETVLTNENDIKITATDLSYTDYSVELNLIIENNSDENLSFVTGSVGYSCCAINGYMIDDGYLNADVAAGKKSNEVISFGTEGLLMYGITEIADIQIGFDITDEDFKHEYIDPVQIKTSAADTYDYETDTYRQSISSGIWETCYNCEVDYYAEEELYHEDDMRIVSEALITNSDGEKLFLLELLNESGKLVNGSAKDISINGLIVQSFDYFLDTVIPGTRRIMMVSVANLINEACLEPFGISEIEEFACTFVLEDRDSNAVTKPQEIRMAISGKATSLDDDGEEVYNKDGIRIVSKGLVEDSDDYMGDIHMLFLIENKGAKAIDISDAYDSLSVNGFMTDTSGVVSVELVPDKCAIIDVKISKSSLEDNRIEGVSDIAEVEMTFEIKNQNFDTIAEPTVKVSY